MSLQERKWVIDHPIESIQVKWSALQAELSTIKHFGKNATDDESDAFRHFMWSGLATQHLGDEKLTREILSLHEQNDLHAGGKPQRSAEMDLHNNEKGIRASQDLQQQSKGFSTQDLEKVGMKALKNGELEVISPGTKEIYSEE